MKTLETLTNILRSETQSLRKQYLEFTEEYAYKDYDRILSRIKWKDVDYCRALGIEPEFRHGHLGFPAGFYNSRDYRTYDRMKSETNKVVRISKSTFIKKSKLNAENHYQESIEKLALRIQKKDLDIKNLVVETSHIGVNIETILTDGIKQVRAFTIIASGDIQRPHYRYLVK